MQNGSPENDKRAVRALRSDLRAADDEKIRRIIAMLDDVSDAPGKQALLDPIRARLGSLKPARPLRFTRLLFIPLDPLAVPATAWRPGGAAIPRTTLQAFAGVVRAGLGQHALSIDGIISGHSTNDLQVITVAGEALWPRAAEVLAASSIPADWSETGLRPALYLPLARTIAAVLRRGPRLRCLLRDGEVAALEADERLIADILLNITDEPSEGCAIIAQLILLQSPHAAPLLRQFISSRPNASHRAFLQEAMAQATERALTQMESPTGSVEEICRAPLADVADHVRKISTLLRELAIDTSTPDQRRRLKGLRDKLDQVCRTKFADGLSTGLTRPLSAGPGNVDREGQTEMEICARHLRAMETAMRKVAGSGHYDDLLLQASETVEAAAQAGILTPVRKLRLIEILSGPDVAASVYREAS